MNAETTNKGRTEKLLETQNLRKSFNVGKEMIEVLKGVSVTINKGEFVIIFGPSGCGKSTLLHCLLGLESPSEGTVLIGGKNFYQLSDDERAIYRRHNVGTIYQQPLWIAALDVIGNVSFPLNLLDVSEEEIYKKAMEKLKIVGMDNWANYRPTELSSGQQQKISLARSLMIDPFIIIADEPTGNLDTMSGIELLQTFMKLVELGKSIVMVTHDLEYLKYADKIYHMVDGLVVEECQPKKNKFAYTGGKKEINGELGSSNVRDVNFLKKLGLNT